MCVLEACVGAAGEAAGLDRLLKTNTSKKRQLSLLRQGLIGTSFCRDCEQIAQRCSCRSSNASSSLNRFSITHSEFYK